ncbi:Zinc finger CCCH domain-containing protein [Quillaja saponaria]|uniref:Zinc finger CCCH domain-containing protein n=1 Tax=Quillaja saponaria TaxID=32244 RepID=A0AAD7LJ55_QUISA|nr:Zinc finger CCCH domain-containing protein [Quillaja saponaria]
MIIGEPKRLIPNVQIPQWDPYDDPTVQGASSFSITSPSFYGHAGGGDCFLPTDSSTAFHRYLSNDFSPADFESLSEELDLPVDAFSGDHFRMFEFKVRKCARGRSHDWTECPYAHPGEKARRRDPRKYHYSGTICPEFRKGYCRKGDSCEFAHGVFECWLHPARYRTQPCKDGTNCRRRVCFFAHTPEQLRVLAQQSPMTHGSGDSSDNGSPIRRSFDSYLTNVSFVLSPTSILTSPPISPPSDSPPTSPNNPQYDGGSFNSVTELVNSVHKLQIGKLPASWGTPKGSGFGSPRASALRPGFFSLPSTPNRVPTRSGLCPFDLCYGEEPAMERVESGRDLRAKMYAKLSKDNSLDQGHMAVSAPDIGWISELVK